MEENIQDKYKKLSREIKIKNEYLNLIYDIAYDYDGCNTVEGLKELIDELVNLVNMAYKSDDTSIIYESTSNKGLNILREEIKE